MSKLRFVLAALVLGAAGCGLADYEQHIDKQREYLKLYDEENELLGPPLEMPKRVIKDAKGGIRQDEPLTVGFFLRPPKGIASKFKQDDPPFVYEGLPLIRYPGPKDPPGYNVLVTTALLAPDKKDGRPEIKGAMKVKDFQRRVRGALMDFHQKQTGRVVGWLSPEFEKTGIETQTSISLQGKPAQIFFQTQELAEQADKKSGALYKVYFTSTPIAQGAIIYQIPAEAKDNATLKRAIQLSVKSYGLADAKQKLTDYRRTHRM